MNQNGAGWTMYLSQTVVDAWAQSYPADPGDTRTDLERLHQWMCGNSAAIFTGVSPVPGKLKIIELLPEGTCMLTSRYMVIRNWGNPPSQS